LPGDVRLVYIPYNLDTSRPTSNIMDAKSGDLLDYQGKPLQEGPRPYVFSDIYGTDGAEEIAALGKAGLFGDFGDSFKPAEGITAASLLRALYLNSFGLHGNTNLTDEEILNKVISAGNWVKEDIEASEPVSRELLAKIMLRYVNLHKLAELPDIFRVDYEDAEDISADAVGYVALAKGTGIVRTEGKTFSPAEGVSRAEAALTFYRALIWSYSR